MYNLKIIEYPNGSAQIRIYSEIIGLGGGDPPEQQWEIEPFTHTKVRAMDNFDRIEENKLKSLSRTKNMISEYARCASWEWFVTLTFSAEKTTRTDFKECMRKTRNWLQNVRKRKAKDLKYLVVPELHADGVSWHVHMLLSDIGSMAFIDSGRKKSGQVIYNIPGWRWGFSTATKVRDIYRIQKYIVKYMTKECHALAVGAHRYYVSNNLPEPVKTVMCIKPEEQDETIKTICDSLGKEIVFQFQYQGYIDTLYIELQ